MAYRAAEFGSFTKSAFSVVFVAALTGNGRKIRKADLSPECRTRIRSLPRAFEGWLYEGPSGRWEHAENAPSLPDAVLHATTAALASCIRQWSPDAPASRPVNNALREVLACPQVSDREKLALLVLPWMVRHHDGFMAAVDLALYSRLREALGIDARWSDVTRPIPGEILSLSEWLLDPAELVALKEQRERDEEEKRIREENERRRIEAERESLRIERERQERIRAERTDSLRRALAAAHGQADPAELVVTDEFQAVFELIEKGAKLLFVTGKPGTGKSTLIRALRDRLSERNVVVLSFTGTAALNVGGQTINSFFAMPPQVLPLDWKNTTRSFRNRAQALEMLIVDEVSMLRPDMLDAMDSSLRAARGDERPFGGVQVILVGDLYQLPPVLGDDPALREYYRRVYRGDRFFVASKVFARSKPPLLELTRVFRQKQQVFLDFLGRVRDATVTGADLDWFNSICRSLPAFGPGEFNLIVTPRRAAASQANRTQLESLPGAVSRYMAAVAGAVEAQNGVQPEDHGRYPADIVLELKPMAQVMFVKNDEGRRWVNGDLGIVEELSDDWIKVTTWSGTWRVERATWPLVRYQIHPDTHRLVPHEYGSFSQFPLRLAWASTIHKMQGQTVDRITIDLTGGAFEAGMTYVALSRCRALEGVRLTRPLLMADLIVDEEILRHLAGMPRHRVGAQHR